MGAPINEVPATALGAGVLASNDFSLSLRQLRRRELGCLVYPVIQ